MAKSQKNNPLSKDDQVNAPHSEGDEQPLPAAYANDQDKAGLLPLIEHAGFIFKGKVAMQQTADVQLKATTTEKTVMAVVEEILLSTDVLRGLSGKEVAIVSEQAAVIKEDSVQLFFTNCLVLGEHALLREIGHVESSRDTLEDVLNLIKMVQERPLQQRVALAHLIVTAMVISCHPVSRHLPPTSEHDPDWWIARVKILSVIKGEKVQPEIEVLFANSTDIAWYKSPKLHEGESGILILHHVKEKEVPAEVAKPIYQIIHPLDFLPSERLQEVQRLYNHEKEGHRDA